jgi:hypothetical protein
MVFHVMFVVLLYLQIKRCSEMARKLRFFKEQMSKADITTSSTQLNETHLDFDDLEVCWSMGCSLTMHNKSRVDVLTLPNNR